MHNPSTAITINPIPTAEAIDVLGLLYVRIFILLLVTIHSKVDVHFHGLPLKCSCCTQGAPSLVKCNNP